MTESYIERRENELKHRIKVANDEARVANEDARAAKELLREISEDEGNKLNDASIKKILSIVGHL